MKEPITTREQVDREVLNEEHIPFRKMSKLARDVLTACYQAVEYYDSPLRKWQPNTLNPQEWKDDAYRLPPSKGEPMQQLTTEAQLAKDVLNEDRVPWNKMSKAAQDMLCLHWKDVEYYCIDRRAWIPNPNCPRQWNLAAYRLPPAKVASTYKPTPVLPNASEARLNAVLEQLASYIDVVEATFLHTEIGRTASPFLGARLCEATTALRRACGKVPAGNTDNLAELWKNAFEAFKAAREATKVGEISANTAQTVLRMWEDFPKIISQLESREGRQR
jgi:hypothetical protein